MKLSQASHKYIFLAACFCIVAALLAASAMADRDSARHRANYERYEAANALFTDKRFEESYKVYKELASIYSDSYVLELKMSICAMNLEMWEEAVTHSRRTLELYPLLAKDGDYMDSLAYSLRELGENKTADQIEDYFFNFAMFQ